MRMGKLCKWVTSVLMSAFLFAGSFAGTVRASETALFLSCDLNYSDGSYVDDSLLTVESVSDPDTDTKRTYQCGDCNITFSLVSSWDSGYNLNVSLENTGDEPIENWHLDFDYSGDITNIWGAQVYEHTDDSYIIKNLSWNADIAPGSTVTFGISENTAFPGFPESLPGRLPSTLNKN